MMIRNLTISLLLTAFALPAYAQDSSETSDQTNPDTVQTDQSEDDWRNSQKKRDAGDIFEDIFTNPNSQGTGGIWGGEVKAIDRLGQESRRHLNKQRAKALAEAGPGEPIDAAFEPSEAAKTDDYLARQEEQAWEEMVREANSGLGSLGNGQGQNGQGQGGQGQGGQGQSGQGQGGQGQAGQGQAGQGQGGQGQPGQGNGNSSSPSPLRGGSAVSAAAILNQIKGIGPAPGQTSGQGPGQGQGTGQFPRQTPGQGTGQSPGQITGQGTNQGAGQFPGQSQRQGSAQGQGQAQNQGQSQAQLPFGLPTIGQAPTPPQSPGQLPQGQLPQGQLPQGQTPQGQAPQGQAPQGQTPQGQGDQGDAVAQAEGQASGQSSAEGDAISQTQSRESEAAQAATQQGGGGDESSDAQASTDSNRQVEALSPLERLKRDPIERSDSGGKTSAADYLKRTSD